MLSYSSSYSAKLTRLALFALLVATVGCSSQRMLISRVQMDASTTDSDAGTRDAATVYDLGEPVHDDCSDNDITGRIGPVVFGGSTAVQTDHRHNDCGGDGAPDTAFLWRAPRDGAYTFDTSGSAFHTVISVNKGTPSCDAPILACNASGTTSSVTVPLYDGDLVHIFVDGVDGASGPFVVNVTHSTLPLTGAFAETCALAAAAPSAYEGAMTIRGNTLFAADDPFTGCAWPGPDVAFRWRATEAGIYSASIASDFASTLSMYGTECSLADDWGCVDSQRWSGSGLEFRAYPGDEFVFVIDAAPPATSMDIGGAAGGNFSVTLTTSVAIPLLGADDTCSPSETARTGAGYRIAEGTQVGFRDEGRVDCNGHSEDATFLWEAPAAGIYKVTTLAMTSPMVGLAAYAGACGGMPLECSGTGEIGIKADYAGQLFQIWIDSLSGSPVLSPESHYRVDIVQSSEELHPNQPDLCSDSMSPNELTGIEVLVGDTLIATNNPRASCDAPGPDVSFLWIAHAAGTYTFDTIHSDFDTVLALYDLSCNGPLLSCDNNSAPDGIRSRAQVTLAANEAVQVFVDGAHASDAGHFVVNIRATNTDGSTLYADACTETIPIVSGTGNAVASDQIDNYNNDARASCDQSGPDALFEWVAPNDGCFAFDNLGTAFDSELEIADVACPSDARIECGSAGRSATLLRSMREGDHVVISIDALVRSASGAFFVNINPLPASSCP